MLSIRRVVLYKHGVGYFEREGEVESDATIDLQFKQREMNDVLKSLTVLDKGGGHIASISYESTKPLSKQLEEIAIRIPSSDVLSGLMNELKGASVKVIVAGKEIRGEIVGVETVNRRSYEVAITDRRLILLVEEQGLRNFDLMDIHSIEFVEEKLRNDIERLLATLISSKKKDLKKLSIFAKGEGKRQVCVTYLVEAPVWKTSYRMSLNDEERPVLQGWALVDNTQDEDWENVSLSLIAGLPVSFVHDLYTARYRRRPVIEIEEETAYGPPELEQVLSCPAASYGDYDEDSDNDDELEEENIAVDSLVGNAFGRGAGGGQVRDRAFAQKAKVQTHSIEAGELYAYEIKNPVTVKRDQSALVPILSERIEGKRIALYNPDIRDKNPMSAVLLKNDTGMTLEGGPVTIVEGDDYVGEAMLDTLKPGDEKIAVYAVELGCLVSRSHHSREQEVYHSLIKDGVLCLYQYRITETVYEVNNGSKRSLSLFFEHRFIKGWELIDTPKPTATTEHFYRFKLEVAAESQQEFIVREKGSEYRSYTITNISRKQLQTFLKARFLDKDTEREIRKLIEMQENISTLEKNIHQREQTSNGIFKNQERLRKNLQVLGARQEEQELRQRYIKQLADEEDSLQHLNREIEKLCQEKENLKSELSEKVHVLHYDALL